ncbi:neutral zinc metallopeptidase [Pelagibius sp. Alg239-R121]|uniref:KPN_02809 family neutral zinc metallopeptidase n=1 Tax=Pelagibius sp. Alg239-R121 TaxID=2993448 RepID=UPI0024A73EA3|nr:neutral zinc metallopeptidase [Pelagibius sp. Alg239-R121]
MKWRGRRQSSNIEDRRGSSGGGRSGRISFPMNLGRRGRGGRRRVGRRSAVGGFGLVAVVVVALLFGVDPSMLLTGMQEPAGDAPFTRSASRDSGSDPLRDFVAVVLADTEDVWHVLFETQLKQRYQEPKLVLFSDGVRSACGSASSAVGPFYCPGDRKVYLDLDFFRSLRERFHAPGDFAQAYVIAHEVGHHVQTLLGISQRVREVQSSVSKVQSNALSVRLELQADCFAGVWANHAERTKAILEQGDIEEALGAASAIGDDTLQRQAGGRVVPDSFTHGSSEQRQRWFRLGLKNGRLEACDTFNANSL